MRAPDAVLLSRSGERPDGLFSNKGPVGLLWTVPRRPFSPCLFPKVLGEAMAGISQNAKTGDLPVFGECVGVASKALCGLTEAAAQVGFSWC